MAERDPRIRDSRSPVDIVVGSHRRRNRNAIDWRWGAGGAGAVIFAIAFAMLAMQFTGDSSGPSSSGNSTPVVSDQWSAWTAERQHELCESIVAENDYDLDANELLAAALSLSEAGDVRTIADIKNLAEQMEASPIAVLKFTASTDSGPFVIGRRRFATLKWFFAGDATVSIVDADTDKVVHPKIITTNVGKRQLWIQPGIYYFRVESTGASGDVILER